MLKKNDPHQTRDENFKCSRCKTYWTGFFSRADIAEGNISEFGDPIDSYFPNPIIDDRKLSG